MNKSRKNSERKSQNYQLQGRAIARDSETFVVDKRYLGGAQEFVLLFVPPLKGPKIHIISRSSLFQASILYTPLESLNHFHGKMCSGKIFLSSVPIWNSYSTVCFMHRNEIIYFFERPFQTAVFRRAVGNGISVAVTLKNIQKLQEMRK